MSVSTATSPEYVPVVPVIAAAVFAPITAPSIEPPSISGVLISGDVNVY